MTAPEVEFLLGQVLQPVVDGQPDEYELRRVDRDNSLIYETGESIDMQAPIHTRAQQLRQANFVGVASEGIDPTPSGTHERYRAQTALSVRIEGMAADKKGNIDPSGENGVDFSTLFDDVFGAIQEAMSYPDVERRTYRDLTITNVDESQSEYADFHRSSFDVLFRGYTDA